MPTYEYACRTCRETFDVFQSMRDEPITVCPKCGQATVKRLIGRGAGIIFKGSGFYETDYKRPPAKEGGADSKGDSKPAEASKSATTAPASTANPGAAAATSSPAKKE